MSWETPFTKSHDMWLRHDKRSEPISLPESNREVEAASSSVATITTDYESNQLVTEPNSKISRPAGQARSEKVILWLKRADQLFLGGLLIILVVLLIALKWKMSGRGQGEIEIVSQQPREYFYSIDINKASWVEWAQLDGIGEKLAKRIVEDRETNGPFESIDNIRRVHGIGQKLLDKLRPFLSGVSVPREEKTKTNKRRTRKKGGLGGIE